MSEKRRDEPRTKETTETIDAARDNTLRIVDELAKVQPQFAQSIANLQLDAIQTYKNMIQTAYATQKQIASSMNIAVPSGIADVVEKQSTEVTNNFIKSTGIANQLALNALEAARENVKIYNRTVDAVTDYNTNVVKAWNSFWSQQQQYLIRA